MSTVYENLRRIAPQYADKWGPRPTVNDEGVVEIKAGKTILAAVSPANVLTVWVKRAENYVNIFLDALA